MRCGLDWHGVIVDPDDLTIRLAKSMHNALLIPQDCTTSKGERVMGRCYSDMVRFVESSGLLRGYSLTPGLKEAVDEWTADGHLLYVISTLDPEYVTSALEVLKEEGVLFNGGWICAKGIPKHIAARRIGLDLLIDDDPSNVKDALDAGIDALLFDRACNRDADPALPRLYGWADRKKYKL